MLDKKTQYAWDIETTANRSWCRCNCWQLVPTYNSRNFKTVDKTALSIYVQKVQILSVDTHINSYADEETFWILYRRCQHRHPQTLKIFKMCHLFSENGFMQQLNNEEIVWNGGCSKSNLPIGSHKFLNYSSLFY